MDEGGSVLPSASPRKRSPLTTLCNRLNLSQPPILKFHVSGAAQYVAFSMHIQQTYQNCNRFRRSGLRVCRAIFSIITQRLVGRYVAWLMALGWSFRLVVMTVNINTCLRLQNQRLQVSKYLHLKTNNASTMHHNKTFYYYS